MMKKLAIIFLFISTLCFSQEDKKMGVIYLEVSQSSRIVGKLKIEIDKDSISNKHYITIIKGSDAHGERLEKNYKERLSEKKYNKIVQEIHKISLSAILSALENEKAGLDGVDVSLSIFGGFFDGVELRFWSPDLDTEKRGLTHYYEACKLIIEAADLNPADYL